MDSAVNTIAGFHGISVGKLKGSARGALICVCFGSGWMYWAVVSSGTQSPLWFSFVTLPAIFLTLWAILRIRAFRHLSPSSAELAHSMRFRKLFWIDFGFEWGLCAIAAFLLAQIGRSDLMPQAFGVIIGLHFLPLAKIFTARLFYWTSGIMVVAAIGSLIIPRSDVRTIAGCMSIGLTLWATGLVILCRISSAGQSGLTVS
jgi:hypothetical protein